MKNDNRRDQLIDIIRKEFIGPDPINLPGYIQKNGEEILTSDPPRVRYTAGILFPQQILVEQAITTDSDEPLTIADDITIEDSISSKIKNTGGNLELIEENDEILNLSNGYHQSAISLTAAVFNQEKVSVSVSAGIYHKIEATDSKTERKIKHYARSPLHWDNGKIPIDLPTKKDRIKEYSIVNSNHKTNLNFIITYRYSNTDNDSTIYTFTLRNIAVQDSTTAVHDEDCYFQVKFSLNSSRFPSMPENRKLNIADEDYQSNLLLYRNVKHYAIGHGCSADWDDTSIIQEIRTEFFPTYEVKPIIPNRINGVSLDMYELSDKGNFHTAIIGLELLCQEYKRWIERLKSDSETLSSRYKETSNRHISNCEKCLQRMISGVELLKENSTVRKAFQYMNRAMLLQQLHYNLPLQTWQDAGDGISLDLLNPIQVMPTPDNKDTWFEKDKRIYGQWRPFQLAFVLINLRSMIDRECDERQEVDLIWFPTGGGKTEAYLGLSAYTIFVRKLLDPSDFGTTILMRYTLRLLTSQQYERASAMICACELIRQEKSYELGPNKISIGLWVGGTTTPNKTDEAIRLFDKLYRDIKAENPFVMLKCPWCGAQMGPISIPIAGSQKRLSRLCGYRKKPGRKKTFIFQCSNMRCDFSKDNNPLPLTVIDEAIYSNPPTLLLGTVDKFAMLPFRPEAQSLFGIHPDHTRTTPPDLIIQDELHLISGPLGSMVGHYETMINELCTDNRNGNKITPKIIASTATISKAKEQCHALYNCGTNHVHQFPPSGINAGNSFFAIEDTASAGRKYMGILAAASPSYATTTIRLYAALLYAAKAINVESEDLRDPYWTNVGYFNSLRELGQAATWVSADIDEYLHTIYKRRHEKKQARYIYEFDELTSRISGDKIPAKLQDLSIRYPHPEHGKRPTDICLATNMISVGVDIPRLGMMTVTGQPKTTSEYIQATSRVGRDSKSPGIIFTTYNPNKARDKSYYEQFKSYHAKLYCHVEPTSVTPFSAPVRERALHAILIGMIRLLGNPTTYDQPDCMPSQEEFKRLFELINNRVKSIDIDEFTNTENHLEEIVKNWKDWKPQKYQDFSAGDVVPLMYPAGSIPNLLWEKRGIATPTSMRNVDASCEVYALNNRYESEVE